MKNVIIIAIMFCSVSVFAKSVTFEARIEKNGDKCSIYQKNVTENVVVTDGNLYDCKEFNTEKRYRITTDYEKNLTITDLTTKKVYKYDMTVIGGIWLQQLFYKDSAKKLGLE